jgi:hypothetical protein
MSLVDFALLHSQEGAWVPDIGPVLKLLAFLLAEHPLCSQSRRH